LVDVFRIRSGLTDFTFIGYSVHGLPLRVWYFEGVRLFAPHSLTKAETVGGG